MEAPLAYQMNTQTITYDTSQVHISYSERIRQRLESLASPPSSVVILPSSSSSDPAVSISTATTGNTRTEQVNERDEALTSFLSLPKVFSVHKFYASPSTPMDEGLQAVWTHQIRDRLNQTLKISIPTGICLQEFMQMGRRADALKPTLVVNCGDAHIKRQVEKAFKSQFWLQEILKSKGITFVALVVKISPSAKGPMTGIHTTPDPDELYAVEIMPGISTSCGLGLLVRSTTGQSQLNCTLGGLICVDGAIVGLTAGHPFQPSDHHTAPDPMQAADHSDGETPSETSSEPFVFSGDDDEPNDTSSTSFIPSHVDSNSTSTPGEDTTVLTNGITFPFPRLMEWRQSNSTAHGYSVRSPQRSHDSACNNDGWALLDDLPLAVKSLPNKVELRDSCLDIPISGTASSNACGTVGVSVVGIGPQLGCLHSSPASMKIGTSFLDVRLITLERPLPLGSSGAWVTLEDKLCGHIIAVRQDLPWAYMLAIELMFDDIKLGLGTDDVRLPTNAEVQLAASYPGTQVTKRHLQETIDFITRFPISDKTAFTSKSVATKSRDWPAVSPKPSHVWSDRTLETETDYFPMELSSNHYPVVLPDGTSAYQELPAPESRSKNARSINLHQDHTTKKKVAITHDTPRTSV
ncbi:MAG: hypothetical protein Q9221_006654 [Calogaya cf. arnoldii]